MVLTRSTSVFNIFVLFLIINLGFAIPGSEIEGTKPKDTLKKEELPQNIVCNKCNCDSENSLIDCTNKLNEWFSENEWAIIQNDKLIFETIKMEHNNYTTIPKFPTYGVKNLYLGYNQISSITIGAFQNLTELSRLDLSNNKLTSKNLLPDVFKGPFSEQDFEPLKNLRSLNLGYNLLHFLNDDLFEHLPNLEELILCSNTFQVIDKLTETALSGLSALKVLDMSYMELKTLPETIFHGPRGLETLIASGNLFNQVPKALSYAKNLKRLVLDENPITNLEGENVFPAMTYLKYLSISYMPELYKIGQGALNNLQNLTELILSDNKMLTEIDEYALAKNVTGANFLDYPPLEKLYLNNCNLTALPRTLIVRWDKLYVIDLRFNPWNCDASNEFMINYLIQRINNSTPLLATNVKCELPQQLKGVEVLNVANDKLLGSSRNGSLVWIVIIVCVLLAVPITISGVIFYRRGYCRCVQKDETAKRALYSRANFSEDFHI
ncbi:leucine-rich repeat transmembrane neuronal protein 3 isoform X3 [Drosophila novamexicana]|uniref:leucine-rich repeat transmembrane neuronal protein 3 isoform X3 n=1 Tax=Drosophila novamexicana TaxID=47314 RepID=UPI0011E5A994|nr:leucine-rich repeat transmembrane neuronal protein 3 isoform X3 [Drosophila novamexicana]